MPSITGFGSNSVDNSTIELNGAGEARIKDAGVTSAKLAPGLTVPIGAAIPWFKTFANTPALPDGWLECNGQTVNDAASPYNGQAVPNLNGNSEATKLFIRGSTTSGTTGGNATHNHSGMTGNNPNQGYGVYSSGANSNVTHAHAISADATIPPYYEAVMILRIK